MGPTARRVVFVATLLVCLFLGISPLPADGFSRTIRDARGHTVTIEDTPTRIFSGGLNVDSTLLHLLSPERLVGVTRFSQKSAYSYVADSASRVPAYEQVRSETVLKRNPDLVILTVYTRSDIRNAIRALDVPVIVTGKVNTLRDIERTTRMIGRAVGKVDRANTWLKRMNRGLNRSDSSSPGPRVLQYTYSGAVPGARTVPDLIFSSAGLRNVAARAGLEGWKVMNPGSILKAQPDWLILQQRNRKQLISKLRNDPALSTLGAVKKRRFKTAQPKYLTVASPFLIRAVRYWSTVFPEDSDESK
jgi:ABC-type Fe3+-hydroxamate transport system substrate-binding protein